MLKEEQVELAHKAGKGDEEAANALFNYAVPIMKGTLHKRGVPAEYVDDCVQDACIALLPKLSNFDGRVNFGFYASKLAVWCYCNQTRSFNNKHLQQLENNVDKERKNPEPGYTDNTFTEEQMYGKFYKEWEKLSDKDQKLFLEATEWGGKLRCRNVRGFPALLEKLRSALLQPV